MSILDTKIFEDTSYVCEFYGNTLQAGNNNNTSHGSDNDDLCEGSHQGHAWSNAIDWVTTRRMIELT